MLPVNFEEEFSFFLPVMFQEGSSDLKVSSAYSIYASLAENRYVYRCYLLKFWSEGHISVTGGLVLCRIV